MKPHTFPYGQREFFGRKWREYGRNRGADAKLGKPLEESQVVVFFSGLSPGEKLFWRYWRCLAPLKNKRGQLLQSQNKSRNWQKNNQWQPHILLFPLIPTKARTTKLAQKLENTQNQLKPCSASGLLRGKLFKDTILTLLDPFWVCWKLFRFVPQLCNKVDRLRAAAYDHLRLARNKLYRYHFDGNYSIFPFKLMSSWNNSFFWTQRWPE